MATDRTTAREKSCQTVIAVWTWQPTATVRTSCPLTAKGISTLRRSTYFTSMLPSGIQSSRHSGRAGAAGATAKRLGNAQVRLCARSGLRASIPAGEMRLAHLRSFACHSAGCRNKPQPRPLLRRVLGAHPNVGLPKVITVQVRQKGLDSAQELRPCVLGLRKCLGHDRFLSWIAGQSVAAVERGIVGVWLTVEVGQGLGMRSRISRSRVSSTSVRKMATAALAYQP